MRIDLVLVGGRAEPSAAWPGEVFAAPPDPDGFAAVVDRLRASPGAEYMLFWDPTLGLPDLQRITDAAGLPGDVWHAGLVLGQGGLPRLLDAVSPVWMLNRDPDPTIVATSWRLSLRACLVRGEVVRRLGGPDARFQTLEGAALELGHRWVMRGALIRHVPWLVPAAPAAGGRRPAGTPSAGLDLEDECRFVHLRYGPAWSAWALTRPVRPGRRLVPALRAYAKTRRERVAAEPGPLAHELVDLEDRPVPHGTVSVLIPTLERYPYLWPLLEQLRVQTVPPLEVIVVDQTPGPAREPSWPERFPDLPLRVLFSDVAGQCTSRNAGLRSARGDYVLFLDDDDEVPPDLIESHLRVLVSLGVDASCGVAEEDGAGSLPESFTIGRVSNVFPTNNTLIRREALVDSGLFDLAYERGIRADHDLGLRLYLAGKLLYLNPQARALHHHAPRGGLREHGSRVISGAAGRRTLTRRVLMAPTEYYQWARFFAAHQVRERTVIGLLATLRGEGGRGRRLVRAIAGLVALPGSWMQMRRSRREGETLLRRYPDIPTYEMRRERA